MDIQRSSIDTACRKFFSAHQIALLAELGLGATLPKVKKQMGTWVQPLPTGWETEQAKLQNALAAGSELDVPPLDVDKATAEKLGCAWSHPQNQRLAVVLLVLARGHLLYKT